MTKRRETLIHKYQAQYENFVALTTSRTTATRYANALEVFFSKFTDKTDPEEFSRVDVEDYVLYRRRDGVKGKTVNYEVQIVRAFWNWMMRMDMVPYNPASTVKRLKEIEPERNALTEAEQIRLYTTAAATGNPLDSLLVGLALSTGLRAQTLSLLEKSDVDFEGSTLRISAAKMKAGRNHDVPLREDVIALLKERPDGLLFAGYSPTAAGLSYRFNKLLRRAGITHSGLRLGRRSFATSLLRSGADLRLVQDLLGHRNIATTSRYLIRADEKTTKDAIEKLPRAPGLTPPEVE